MGNREYRRLIEERYRQNHRQILSERSRQWRINHPGYLNQYLKQLHCKRKREVLAHYSNGKSACVICGENRIDCLSIDHINNNGNRHRREIGNLYGTNFYRWLEKEGFPEGYQTLCMNCQFIKASRRKEELNGNRGYWKTKKSK